ncbi:hypothetical protein BV133_1067 [Blastochloris viridis]|uniref:Lipopolysaccharide heptosyltransferase I n=2 Tax=Blastochloris viridis TaxID=1079 RepID=A0A0H5B8X0_BLAVI|nr:hypothetical protein BV133_1067 [Blastochloris viridis]CUU44002.1 lipopolysaccharide heptosyltransferase I [Blastochloris viridis]
MMGLGDVAAILVPAVRLIRRRHPEARIDVMTFAAGSELMALMPEVADILHVAPEQWPDPIEPALHSASALACTIIARSYDRVINFDTWFFPCLIAQFARECGVAIEGNHLNLAIPALVDGLATGRLPAAYFRHSDLFIASTFPNISDWKLPWWDRFPDWPRYPDFYLSHCCGLAGPLDMSLAVAADPDLIAAAAGRPVVSISASGRRLHYRGQAALTAALTQAGFHVWSQFDGSAPIAATLARLRATDLLITVPTSTQWLARTVGCPTLLVPGSQPPPHLGADVVADPVIECQYCGSMTCPKALDYPCLAVPAAALIAKAEAFLAERPRRADAVAAEHSAADEVRPK